MRPGELRDVQSGIFEQHREIRARLHGLSASAHRAAMPWAARALRASLIRFAERFDTHLGYEERVLVPFIRDVDAWGPAREAALLAEHVEQRARIEEVCALTEEVVAIDVSRLRDEVSELVASLLADMSREEQMLLALAQLDEDGAADQMTG